MDILYITVNVCAFRPVWTGAGLYIYLVNLYMYQKNEMIYTLDSIYICLYIYGICVCIQTTHQDRSRDCSITTLVNL